MRKSKGISVFEQYGFKEIDRSGVQVFGNCIFCGSDKKFYVNYETKKWDCKVCGEHGGYYKFIETVFHNSQHNHHKDKLKELAHNRKLEYDTLKDMRVGYFQPVDKYILPHFSVDREKILTVFGYQLDSHPYNTSGADVSLINAPALAEIDNKDIVWLVEGHWDTYTMYEILKKLETEKQLTVGVPGANTFLPEWTGYFKGKDVFVLYDNDYSYEKQDKTIFGAGTLGMIKVHNLLASIVRSIRYIHWPKNYKDGYDVRDFYVESGCDARKTIRGIKNLCKPLPPDYEESETVQNNKVELKGTAVDYKAVHKVYAKWLELVDKTVIDVLFATCIANLDQGDLIWTFIVGKSGDAKSVLLSSLFDSRIVVPATSLTPESLISGFGASNGADPSILSHIDGKILAVKDFTTILSMNPIKRDEIFGIFRDVYDERIDKSFGNGIQRSYNPHFGFIAGVTPAIELYTEGHTALGERFLRFKIKDTDSDEMERSLCRKAMKNVNFDSEMKEDLSKIAAKVLEYDYRKHSPHISEDIEEKIITLSQWVATMRGSINRDKYSKEITHKPMFERPTRLSKQFYKYIVSIARFRQVRKATTEEYNVAKYIGVSTVPSKTELTTRLLFNTGREKSFSSGEIREFLGLPDITSQRTIENLSILGILDKIKLDGKGVMDRYKYKLSDRIKSLSERAGIYES